MPNDQTADDDVLYLRVHVYAEGVVTTTEEPREEED